MHQNLRGWSKDQGKKTRDQKVHLLNQIKCLHEHADSSRLDVEEWALLRPEDQLLNIYRVEEEYWHQRRHIQWSLQGDANTHISTQ
jgi:hypothetical protein